ncbi:hypothetical protein [Bacillus cereus]|uniref:hypothetical protein n=1 Tax=Bacillus cereus TaxID=1396 RepID=UPI0015D47A17|nr:hypothetical protein [Bacillus cereus]
MVEEFALIKDIKLYKEELKSNTVKGILVGDGIIVRNYGWGFTINYTLENGLT